MNAELVNVELIEDRACLSNLSEIACSEGEMLVCHRCNDASELIAGIVVIPDTEEAWVLCGDCWREIPQGVRLAS
jgi:hypothetical protein